MRPANDASSAAIIFREGNERDIFQIAPNCRFWQKNPKTRQFQPYSNRPKPWNKIALKATFATFEFDTRPQAASYKVDFLYDVQNTTERNYDFISSNFTLLAVLAEGNALSKEFGHYQAEKPRLDGPAFIPAHGKARIHVVVAYAYPSEWTTEEKNDAKKVIKSLNYRLRELTGFGVRPDQSLRDRYARGLAKLGRREEERKTDAWRSEGGPSLTLVPDCQQVR